MKSKNRFYSTYFIIIFGAFILIVVFLVSDYSCEKYAYNDINDTLEYLKYQCIRYDEITDDEEAKSLVRIADKAYYFQQDLLSSTVQIDNEYTKEYLNEQRLSGVIITNNETGLFFTYSIDDVVDNTINWEEIVKSRKEIAGNSKKCYVERIYGNKYCYDYAIISRNDNKGIILCYLRQNIDVVLGSQLSISTLLDGFNIDNNGLVFFTNSKSIVSSNVENYNGTSISDCDYIKTIDINETGFVKTKVNNKTYYALSGRIKKYYIYVLYPSTKIFINRSLIFSYSSVVYIALIALSILFNQKIIQVKRKQEELLDKKYKDELNDLANKAIKANSLKSDFLKRMSHDIRTPITTIRGLVEIGNYYKNDLNKQIEIRNKIYKSSGYLLDLVNDVLDMSKLEDGINFFKNEPFSLKEILNDVYEICKSQASDEGISLLIKEENIIHDNLVGSKLHLKRVFINMINNAIKYNKKNGKVTLSCNEMNCKNNMATFQFICTDTGIGMSKEFQEKMFEPFSQENPTDTKYGTGLGLAIVKRIVEKMNGNINVNSILNEGTTMTLEIPFIVNNNDNSLTNSESNNLLSLDGITILIAEDNEINQEIIKFFLKNAKANVICANNGKEAYEKFLENDNIDIILMDIIMPIMDGMSSCIKIRNSNKENAKTIPIIALSANSFKDDIDKAINAGMNGHIAKPINSTDLIKEIKHQLNIKNSGGGV